MQTMASRAPRNIFLKIGFGILFLCTTLAGAQTWTPLTHPAPFSANTAFLLTDGTVMIQSTESGNWWRLTPDNMGSYVNGTWSQLAGMPSGYGPFYYASAVLPDGRLIVEGGEFNLSGGGVWTNMGGHLRSREQYMDFRCASRRREKANVGL